MKISFSETHFFIFLFTLTVTHLFLLLSYTGLRARMYEKLHLFYHDFIEVLEERFFLPKTLIFIVLEKNCGLLQHHPIFPIFLTLSVTFNMET